MECDEYTAFWEGIHPPAVGVRHQQQLTPLQVAGQGVGGQSAAVYFGAVESRVFGTVFAAFGKRVVLVLEGVLGQPLDSQAQGRDCQASLYDVRLMGVRHPRLCCLMCNNVGLVLIFDGWCIESYVKVLDHVCAGKAVHKALC